MTSQPHGWIPEKDLDFIVGAAAPGSASPERFKRLMQEDAEFRAAMVGDDGLFDRVMNDEEIFLHVSPSLYFEVLLRRAHRELQSATHTLERSGRESIPVFDTDDVLELLKRPHVIEYLASMLASFTRVHSYTVPMRVRRGVRRRIRYNDMDVDSLVRFAATVEPMERFSYYKRIADVCLFVTGVFPDHAQRSYKKPGVGRTNELPRSVRNRRTVEDYERDGRRFYGMAQRHPTARMLELTDVFGSLKGEFTTARKPLTFISTRYLHASKRQVFGGESP
ncbi:MAG: hypothetical protein FI707_14560 [SAR202 cluster bacterium]|jgi:hypothetical protein|nr:hypothetical protein [Chloroflexota bacterium]MDP6422460.1 hypothetical protein [SAR202 cluster bacterium]HAL47673.1 hypothetical protein [Dehalococcoidia bacterium]MDP6663558.1 hypothetical protein [SAR202 cluster bacterium]MDP6800720.1 hypothetical protein [SAR202 cluster bacterium]|tara:strand:+ start:4190 stop:5026 length:837 start_codon:yes stop_codon:yes gene_type:complete